MIRISVTAAAFEAIAASMPLGFVGYEREPDAKGERAGYGSNLGSWTGCAPCAALARAMGT
jgi:hypothetical protein